jgi:hypothetical protein
MMVCANPNFCWRTVGATAVRANTSGAYREKHGALECANCFSLMTHPWRNGGAKPPTACRHAR